MNSIKTLLGALALGAVVLGTVSCEATEGAAGKKPVATATETVTAAPVAEPEPTPEPESIDPDTEYLTTMANDTQYMSRMETVMGQLEDFGTAADNANFTSATRAGHAAADSYDWLADRIDSKPISSDSTVAQSMMSAFRQCRDAYDNAATAINDLDIDGMNAAANEITACTRSVEAATAQM
jgi:hypothetical protein